MCAIAYEDEKLFNKYMKKIKVLRRYARLSTTTFGSWGPAEIIAFKRVDMQIKQKKYGFVRLLLEVIIMSPIGQLLSVDQN